MSAIIPIPRSNVSVRVATLADLPFLDALQKQHNKQLGYFPTKQFEGYIEMGAVLVAESRDEETERRRDEVKGAVDSAHSVSPSLRLSVSHPLGYIISRDRYLKRDELGVVYQLCVVPGEQRKLVGAALVREVFARSAYGCKLYCCWCAQDLDANHFWESVGFVPIAFRAGSAGKRRVHIFWQKRINDGDTATPWWYPCATNAGAIREDRLVFPIPPGTHWKDVQASVLPDERRALASGSNPPLPDGRGSLRARNSKQIATLKQPTRQRLQFGPPGAKPQEPPAAKKVKPAKPPRAKLKNDPKLVAAARELRDRYLEHVNSGAGGAGGATRLGMAGKYDIARAIGDHSQVPAPIKQLPHAA